MKTDDTQIQEMAEELHNMVCTWNHTDGCDWHYGNWEDNPTHARKKYYNAVKGIVDKHDTNRAKDMLALMRVGRRCQEKFQKEMKLLTRDW